MTHDELLDAINKQIITAPPFALGGYTKFLQGLSAVVELHKPVQSYMFEEEACSHCSSEEARLEILYPCPTIQAIEELLK